MTVEQAAIIAAQAYAMTNGYSPDDRRAVGLVLAGMAIAATASQPAQRRIVDGYLRDFPQAEAAIRGWGDRLTIAAVDDRTGPEIVESNERIPASPRTDL